MAAFHLSRRLVRVGYPQSYPRWRDIGFGNKNKMLYHLAENSVKKYPLTRG